MRILPITIRKLFLKNIILSGLTTLLIVSGCTNVQDHKRNFVCFIDLSTSIDAKNYNEYVDILINDVYSNMTNNDRIMIYPLDYASITEAKPIIIVDMSEVDFGKVQSVSNRSKEMKILAKKYIAKTKDSLINKLISIKKDRSNFGFQTNILGAMEKVYRNRIDPQGSEFSDGVKRWWNSERGYSIRNYIFIFSDMIHENDEFNFRSLNSVQQSEAVIQKLKDTNRIPDLNNFIVYINGITAYNNKSLLSMEHFWKKYFEYSNANLPCASFSCAYEIGSELKN